MPTPTPTPTIAPSPEASATPEPTDAPTPEPSVSALPAETPRSTPTPGPVAAQPPDTAPPPAPSDAAVANPSPAPAVIGPTQLNPLSVVFDAAVQQVSSVVKPEAAAVVAVTFGFPLVLNAAVVLFLMVQGWVDARDPKLRVAPQTAVETIVPFQDEEKL